MVCMLVPLVHAPRRHCAGNRRKRNGMYDATAENIARRLPSSSHFSRGNPLDLYARLWCEDFAPSVMVNKVRDNWFLLDLIPIKALIPIKVANIRCQRWSSSNESVSFSKFCLISKAACLLQSPSYHHKHSSFTSISRRCRISC